MKLKCFVCDKKVTILLPPGWNIEQCVILCNEHAFVNDWFITQCYGCQYQFPFCAVGNFFSRRHIIDCEMKDIKIGFCPKRTVLGIPAKAEQLCEKAGIVLCNLIEESINASQ